MKVLSLEGGGIKGIYTATELTEVEKHLDFDFYAGNSTGSIIAAAKSLGYSSHYILDMYLHDGVKLFEKDYIRFFSGFNGFLFPKYDARKLEKLLRRFFGEKKLKDCEKKMMCNSYDITKDEPIYFKSWKDEFSNLKIWEVVKASCSAQTYFSAHNMQGSKYVDGGTESTCIVLAAYSEARKILQRKGKDEKITIINIGTGYYKNNYCIGSEGMKDWATQIIPLFMSANAESQKYILRNTIRETDHFADVNRKLAFPIQLDDISEKAIKELRRREIEI